MARFNVLNKTVDTAGTAERISATDLWVRWFIIEFDAANSGSNVYRGDSSVDNTYPTITETKGFTWSLPGYNFNLKEMWLDVDTNGDGVFISYDLAHKTNDED